MISGFCITEFALHRIDPRFLRFSDRRVVQQSAQSSQSSQTSLRALRTLRALRALRIARLARVFRAGRGLADEGGEEGLELLVGGVDGEACFARGQRFRTLVRLQIGRHQADVGLGVGLVESQRLLAV